MPELPEVETTRRGIAPHITHKTITQVIVRNPSLRYPVPETLPQILRHQTVQSVHRRSKYLLLDVESGIIIVHLGMSGHLRIVDTQTPANKHDHIDVHFADGTCLRYCDPRRFGMWLWTTEPIEEHRLIAKLGPEPLTREFNAKYLATKLAKRKTAIKSLIMDASVVVGVGNIYASESLFSANIDPRRESASLNFDEIQLLTQAIKKILRQAIKQGGTTLKDFLTSDGKPGYFRHKLKVYGRNNEPCFVCDDTIKSLTLNQRNTFYCETCQE